MGKILNYGSTNIDEFFSVPHICKSGETLSSTNYFVRAGGKGANQSVALAKAGSQVFHAGRMGGDAKWVRDTMVEYGVDMSLTEIAEDQKNGRAFIQVSEETRDNCIVLFPGTNATYTGDDAVKVLEHFGPGDWIIQQNEISGGGDIMRLAAEKGLSIIFNPAPLTKGIINDFPFNKIDILVVNEHEAADLYKELQGSDSNLEGLELATALFKHFDQMQGLVVTLGGEGVVAKFRYQDKVRDFKVPSIKVKVKDTTAAGDTFVGYFLSTFVSAENEDFFVRVQHSLEQANFAASLAVQREGSMISVPTLEQVEHHWTSITKKN
ncbi:PfkB domain-containing protein [Halteromyces radiatus]|uniref:PfkB domain-containing protein n=1 Tax=Halteromyces radiatus TaxID=101107 RepID=UPI00221EC6A0|nr:PfkB domain-containing protein [Halteromyces radiatus]KAI8099477.1 PfkB domain-containing protein [Halteromyces radiatus]